MKYIISLILGMAVGAAICAVGVIYNPFLGQQDLSPLAVTEAPTLTLTYSGLATDGIAYTNDGESRVDPYPEKVLQLWEQPIRQSFALATVLRDGRNQAAGFGIKMSSYSEDTKLLAGKALSNSVWYIYVPGKGAMFIEQTENYWDYLRDVVVQGYRSSADTWNGTWLGNMTAGPGALGTARVSGGNGEYAGEEMIGVESLSVRTWRAESGLAAAEGRLIIELPVEQDVELTSLDEL